MKSSCVFFLALALFGALANACVTSVCSPSVCCRGGYGLGYGAGYDVGYGGGYGNGYAGGCASVCETACSPTVCDTCQCVKTVVRPPIVERIPYACRRVQSPACATRCGMYPATSVGVYGGGAASTGFLNGGYGGYAGGYGGGYGSNVVV